MSVVHNFSAVLPSGRRFEGWANGIAFDSALVSADGASFELYPVRGRHTRADVAEAKRQLRNARDVVGFYETWQPAGMDIPRPPADT